jgi:exopolysaccharide biosynthesis polyprenyl glycosylphosphotransferase
LTLAYLGPAESLVGSGREVFQDLDAAAPANITKKVSLLRATVAMLAADCCLFVMPGLLLRPFDDASAAVRDPHYPEVPAILFGLAIFLICQQAIGGYRSRLVPAGRQSLCRLLVSLNAAFFTLLAIGAATNVSEEYSAIWFVSWTLATVSLATGTRWAMLAWLRGRIAEGACVRRTLTVRVGAGEEGLRVATSGDAGDVVWVPGLEALDAVERYVREREIDEIYVPVAWQATPDALRDLRRLRHLAVNIYLLPCLGEPGEAGAVTGGAGRFQIQLAKRPIAGWAYGQKRAFDVVVACAALFVLWPVMAVAALAVKLESPGPILFRQRRQGVNGQPFAMLKFRSMYDSASDRDAQRQTCKGDVRVTRVGRLIRRTSIDELPQLFNVLKGDMSIVGPRPHALETKAEGQYLDRAVDDYAARHRVKPGMTGWAQVKGLRGELDTIEKLRRRLEHDVYYIEHWSVGFDFRIVMMTLWLVLWDPAAY